MIRTVYYRISKGRVASLSDPLYVATVTGPYLDIIGHNGAGLSISDAVENLKRHLKTTEFAEARVLWDEGYDDPDSLSDTRRRGVIG